MLKSIAIGLLAGAFLLQAGEEVPKQAGVAFRFDDNKPPKQWKEMGELFEKHGCRMSLALISQNLNGKETQEVLRALSAKGHTMMDHTPNHALYQIQARTPQEFAEYSKLPIVDHADPKSRKVYFKYELDSKHPGNRKFQGAIRNGELCEYPADLKGQLGYTRKILDPSIGKVYGIRIQDGKKMLYSFWGEKIAIPDRKGEFVLLASNVAIQPSKDLLRFMAETSRKNFLAIGLPAPRAWIQPGGWECFISWDRIADVYGKEFGYVSGDAIPGSSQTRRNVFNDPNPTRGRFTMTPDFTGPDNGQDFPSMKRNIANSVARNQSIVFISHMSIHRVKGGWEAFIKGYDDLLQWLKKHNIPVKTQEEWAETLYSKKPQPNTNILPPLNRDIDEDGKPDGYELVKGTTTDLKTGIATIPAGGKLHISDVGGVEKGTNNFSISVKGEPGTIVILDFFFTMREGNNYMERKQFRLDGSDWKTLSGTVNVKPQAHTLHYGVLTNGTKTPIQVKDPVFKQ